jgi:hypothetical protein
VYLSLNRSGSRSAWGLPLVALVGCCLHPSGAFVGDAGVVCSGPASPTVPTFGPAISLAGNTGYNWAVAVGDVNGDGLADLLQSNSAENSDDAAVFGVYFGLADGGLSAPQRFFGGALFAAMFDPKDGAAVAAVGYPLAGLDDEVDVFAGDGQILGKLGVPGGQPVQFAVTDLDGDGRPDLAVCEFDVAEAFLNLGAGSLGAAVSLPTPTGCVAIAAADVNRDGHPDLVALGYLGEVTVMVADKHGSYVTTSYATNSTGVGSSCVLQDLNGDGLPDIVVTGAPGPFVLLNEGGGRFKEAVLYSAQNNASHLFVADMNGDCWPDVLISAELGLCSDPVSARAGLYLFLNRGDGTFLAPIPIDSGLSRPYGIAAYRGPGAKLPSIAVADKCTGQLEILPNLTKP